MLAATLLGSGGPGSLVLFIVPPIAVPFSGQFLTWAEDVAVGEGGSESSSFNTVCCLLEAGI